MTPQEIRAEVDQLWQAAADIVTWAKAVQEQTDLIREAIDEHVEKLKAVLEKIKAMEPPDDPADAWKRES